MGYGLTEKGTLCYIKFKKLELFPNQELAPLLLFVLVEVYLFRDPLSRHWGSGISGFENDI